MHFLKAGSVHVNKYEYTEVWKFKYEMGKIPKYFYTIQVAGICLQTRNYYEDYY